MRLREAIAYSSISLATLSGCGEYKPDQATCSVDSIASSTAQQLNETCNSDTTTPAANRKQTSSEAISDTMQLVIVSVALTTAGLLIKASRNSQRR